jgi:hypothetical protein
MELALELIFQKIYEQIANHSFVKTLYFLFIYFQTK